MQIKTAEGWKPLAVKSIPAPKDRTMLDTMDIPNATKPGDIGKAYCDRIERDLEASRRRRAAMES